MKLATVIKSKDPYVPLLQSFSYSLLISKIKSYIELFVKENESNFLIQVCQNYFENLFQKRYLIRLNRFILSRELFRQYSVIVLDEKEALCSFGLSY